MALIAFCLFHVFDIQPNLYLGSVTSATNICLKTCFHISALFRNKLTKNKKSNRLKNRLPQKFVSVK